MTKKKSNLVYRRMAWITANIRALLGPWIKQFLRLDTEYSYGEFSITLPPGHRLEAYQRLHPRYDRFLPHLVRYLVPHSTVLDVGANCGDSLASMIATNAGLHYVCFEADPGFFRYLSANARKIKAKIPQVSIFLHETFVGRSVAAAGLSGSAGTKHALVVEALGAPLLPTALDAMRGLEAMDRVMLLKSDVDGFDYDVIDSAENLIESQSPLLFFECDFRDSGRRAEYVGMIERLASRGYRHWTVFDNFGEVMLQAVGKPTVVQLLDYLERQNAGVATRTIHYVDLLAARAPHEALAVRAVADYVGGVAAANQRPCGQRP
jgi:FkbM family methyltransferase